MKKNTKKYSYVIDMTCVTTVDDLVLEIITCKLFSNCALTKDEAERYTWKVAIESIDATIAATGIFDKILDTVSEINTSKKEEKVDKTETVENTKVEKKPNIFKRFWNWITRKK